MPPAATSSARIRATISVRRRRPRFGGRVVGFGWAGQLCWGQSRPGRGGSVARKAAGTSVSAVCSKAEPTGPGWAARSGAGARGAAGVGGWAPGAGGAAGAGAGARGAAGAGAEGLAAGVRAAGVAGRGSGARQVCARIVCVALTGWADVLVRLSSSSRALGRRPGSFARVAATIGRTSAGTEIRSGVVFRIRNMTDSGVPVPNGGCPLAA